MARSFVKNATFMSLAPKEKKKKRITTSFAHRHLNVAGRTARPQLPLAPGLLSNLPPSVVSTITTLLLLLDTKAGQGVFPLSRDSPTMLSPPPLSRLCLCKLLRTEDYVRTQYIEDLSTNGIALFTLLHSDAAPASVGNHLGCTKGREGAVEHVSWKRPAGGPSPLFSMFCQKELPKPLPPSLFGLGLGVRVPASATQTPTCMSVMYMFGISIDAMWGVRYINDTSVDPSPEAALTFVQRVSRSGLPSPGLMSLI